jgi:DNA-binding NtrC family response regulator
MNANVLIIEDDAVQRHLLQNLLRHRLGLECLLAEHGREGLDILNSPDGNFIRLIILDLQMPVMDGMETLGLLKKMYPSIPVIMLTGSNDIQDAVECIKKGAIDFITKPYDGQRMVVTIKNAMKIGLLTNEVTKLKNRNEGTFCFEDLIGYNDGLSHAVQLGRKAAACNIPILITGRTGTGKELFANAIHNESARAKKPLIAINCGAIPTHLVESTLFGHEKGAFTGATEKSIGKFREAQGGTIFLDEIGELPLDAQVKLLRVLQQKEVEPVGAGKSAPVDVRIISATNRDLEHDVRAGKFREDLYFRLNVLNIALPDLKSRKNDIAFLAHSFMESFCAAHDVLPKKLSKDTIDMLENYAWPGNVRELENAVNRAMVICNADILDPSDFSFSSPAPKNLRASPNEKDNHKLDLFSSDGTLKKHDEIEYAYIHFALNHFENNITQAAKATGMAKSTFYKKIRRVD